MRLQKGTVRFFSSQREFGHLISETGEEIFFRYGEGNFFVSGTTKPQFLNRRVIGCNDGTVLRLRYPVKDEQIVFVARRGERGKRAVRWGYYSQYLLAETQDTFYRVLETVHKFRRRPRRSKILWEGSDLTELAQRFPVARGEHPAIEDRLYPYLLFFEGNELFEATRWWELKDSPNDQWIRVDDPRLLIEALRQFERPRANGAQTLRIA